jgi:phosphatidate cytidylyltransferase
MANASEAPQPSTLPGKSEASAPATSPSLDEKAKQTAFIKNTLSRFATAVVGIPILLYLMFWAPPWAFALVVLGCIARAAHEMMRMTVAPVVPLQVVGVISTTAFAAVLIFSPTVPAITTAVFAVGALGALAALYAPEPNDAAGVRLAWLIAGPLYVGGLLSHLGTLHQMAHGGEWVLLAMWFAWASDTGAYFAGRFFGQHKLAPRVSPSKTIEGSIGGLLGSLTGALAAHFWFLPSLPLSHAIGLAIVGGGLGQAGDLVESLIKRSTKVKDSGSILPGHGGLLDRVDALMLTATTCVLYNLWVLG